MISRHGKEDSDLPQHHDHQYTGDPGNRSNRDDHGTPTHRPLREWPDDPHPLHVGAYDAAQCTLRDWFENDDECFGGTATFPVTATWTDGHYVFTLAGGAS